MKLKWTKKPHPIWGKNGPESNIREMVPMLHWPRFQWKADKYSIIFPRPGAKHNPPQYELFDGEDVWVFDTLKESKDYAQSLIEKHGN